MPHTLGALDGKHIAVNCLSNSGNHYFNKTKHFSIVLLAIWEAHYITFIINVGTYGSQSYGGVLANSALGEALRSGILPIPPDEYMPNSNIKVPHFLLGIMNFH